MPVNMDHCVILLGVAFFAISCASLVDLDEAAAWWAKVSKSEADRLRLSIAFLLNGHHQ